MGRQLSDIANQPLSSLVSDHLICEKCRVVDRDNSRMRAGYCCPTCGKSSDAGRLYFSINIHILVDLLQEAYHSDQQSKKKARLYRGCGSHDIAVIIYFCTLRETLLDKFIIELLNAQNIPKGIFKRILADNKFHRQKQDKLFSSLTDVKWKNAISSLNEASEINYIEIDEFVHKIAKIRNCFIHEGSKWSIDRELSTNCINNIWSLINLYVGLHNMFVHPLYREGV